MNSHRVLKSLSLALLTTPLIGSLNIAQAASCSAKCTTGYSYTSGKCEFTKDENKVKCGGHITCTKWVWEKDHWEQDGVDTVACDGTKTKSDAVSATHAKATCQSECPHDYEYSSGKCSESVTSASTGEFACKETTAVMCKKETPATGPTTATGGTGGPAKDPLGPPPGGGSSGTPAKTDTKGGDCVWRVAGT